MTSISRLVFSSALVIGTLLSSASFAQTAGPGPQAMPGGPGPMGMRTPMGEPERMHGMMGFPKMQEQRDNMRAARHQKHLDEMKVYLQLQASQEAAWQSFAGVMKTPIKRPTPMAPSELEKLTTPERIDKMMAQKAERDAEIAKRMNASKTFYATLSPTQQKVFDTHTQKLFAKGPMGRHARMHP